MPETSGSLAPKTLDELRDLVASLHNGDSDLRLGNRAFQTLTGMVDTPGQTAVTSISDLARTLGVNASTLSRLAKRLGYGGFSDFQGVFRRHLANEQDYYSKRANRFIHDSDEDQEEDRNEREETRALSISLMAEIANDEAANTNAMLSNINPAALHKTAELLAGADSIRVHGLRQFYSVACFMAYGLGLIRDNVEVLGDSGHGVAHALARLQTGDTIVVLGSEPYTRASVDACRIAAAHGFRVIALTDSYESPLATSADQVFIIPTGGHFFGNNVAATIVFIEGLLMLVARELGDSAVEALKKRERLFEEMGVTIGSGSRGT